MRVESVIARHGTHDVYQQMLLEAIFFVQRLQYLSDYVQIQKQWLEDEE